MERVSDQSAQTGMAMIMSLLLLLVITMLAATSIRGTVLQERMKASMEDYARALEAAEAALRAAERELDSNTDLPFSATGNNGYYASGNRSQWPDWLAAGASTAAVGANEYTPSGMALRGRSPQYLIERTGASDAGGISPGQGVDATEWEEFREGGELFRIRARGFGSTDDTVVVLEALYRP